MLTYFVYGHQSTYSNWVSLSMSHRFFFKSSATRVSARVCSFFLSDLSYSPNLALTLMSAHLRRAKARACSYTSRRDFKKSRRLILNDVPLIYHNANVLCSHFVEFLCLMSDIQCLHQYHK